MPGSVTVPSTLSGHAAEIWRAAFLASYGGTCAKRTDRDACAASIAWSAVKEKYRKGQGGTWVAKGEEAAVSGISPMSAGEYPQPMAADKPKGWKDAYNAALVGECAKAEDPAACASVVADAAVKRSEGTVKRQFIPLHRNDYGDLSLPLVLRKDYSPEKRAEFAKKGWALPDGSYPIADMGDLMDAIHSYGRGGDKPEVKAHIRKRARQLGALDQVSAEWGGREEKSMSAAEQRRMDEALADQELLDRGLGAQIAARPESIGSNEWMKRPLQERTVSALIAERAVARTYEAAVERTMAEGWQAISNPTRREEFVFQRWIDTPDGALLQRAVLVRRAGTVDWRLRELTRGASMSLAVQIPANERRFGDNRL